MVMYEDNARRINAALAALNPQAVPHIISLGHADAMLQVQQALDDGQLVGFLADRTLAKQPTLSVPFLGTPAPFPLGAFRLAALLRRRVLLMQGIYLGGRRSRVRSSDCSRRHCATRPWSPESRTSGTSRPRQDAGFV